LKLLEEIMNNDGITGESTYESGDITYQIGDRIRFLDMEGAIIATVSDYWHRYMTVRLDSGRELLFEKDGSYWPESSHKLQVIGKAKPKVKKYRYAYDDNGKCRMSDHYSEIEAALLLSNSFPKHTKLEWTLMEVGDA
jgi:hypothetical protein